MVFQTRSVHHHVTEEEKEYIDKKVEHLKKFDSGIESFELSITKNSDETFTMSANIHFHWKHHSHISHSERSAYACLDILFSEIEKKCRREKDKATDHHRHNKLDSVTK